MSTQIPRSAIGFERLAFLSQQAPKNFFGRCSGAQPPTIFSLGHPVALVQLNRQKNEDSKIIPVKTIAYVNYHAFPKDAVTY
jgi:hypothetical protein